MITTEPQPAVPAPTRRWFRYGLRTLLAATVIVAIIVGLSSMIVMVWDGRFELPLKPASEPRRQVQSVWYQTVNQRELADLIVQSPKGREAEMGFRQAERQNDEFVASIDCGGKEGVFGIELSYYQPQFIVVRLTYDDGSEVLQVAEIPVERGRRHATLRLPKASP